MKCAHSNLNKKRHSRIAKKAFGFSLVELLVVIVILGTLTALTLPYIVSMVQSARISSAVNTVSMAVASGRRLSTELVNPSVTSVYPDGAQSPPSIPAAYSTTGGIPGLSPEYSGVALVFTPSGEIRITYNDINLLWNGVRGTATAWYMESGQEHATSGSATALNGYRDLKGFDYIQIPRKIRVKGIVRTGTGTHDTFYIDPPFAVRFDQNGKLIINNVYDNTLSTDKSMNNWIYYFHNPKLNFIDNAAYEFSETLSNSARSVTAAFLPAESASSLGTTPETDPDYWDKYWKLYEYRLPLESDNYSASTSGSLELGYVVPGSTSVQPIVWDADENKYRLPFGRLVSVAGVRIWDIETNEYKDVFFSQYTGESLFH